MLLFFLSLCVLILSWFGSSISSVIIIFSPFHYMHDIFLIPNPISRYWLYVNFFFVSESFILRYIYFGNSFILSMNIGWIIFLFFSFFCNLLSLYPPPHDLSKFLIDIISSLWKMLLWIFPSDEVFSSGCKFQIPIFHIFSDEFDEFDVIIRYIVHLNILKFSFAGTYHILFYSQSTL